MYWLIIYVAVKILGLSVIFYYHSSQLTVRHFNKENICTQQNIELVLIHKSYNFSHINERIFIQLLNQNT